MKIYDLVAKYHYSQVVNNPRYRELLAPGQELDIEEFKKFLQRLEDMKEDNNVVNE